MISEKMKKFTKNSSAIRAMFEEGIRLKKLYGEENVCDFSLGNPVSPPPESVKNAVIKVLEEMGAASHEYTVNAGDLSIRQFVADATNKEFETNFSAQNVILTCGAAGGLNIILKAILNPDDEVITFAPFFGEYRAYTENYDGKLIVAQTNASDFQPNFESFENALTDKTKAVIINTPNNPSGAIYSAETLKKLAEIMERKSAETGKPIYLISDEPYRRIVFDGAQIPYVTRFYKNSFVAYSFSKALSLPGERIGYVIVSDGLDDFDEMTNALTVANRILGFVNAPSLFQHILPYCMNETADTAVYERNRNKLYDILTNCGFECFKPDGAFYMFPKSPIADDVEFCAEAKKLNILSAPGSSFGCPGYFRLAFCVSEETVDRSEQAFRKLAEKYGVIK